MIHIPIPSCCTECGMVRTVIAIDTAELISIITDIEKPVAGICTGCHTPWVLGRAERQEVAYDMATAMRTATEGIA